MGDLRVTAKPRLAAELDIATKPAGQVAAHLASFKIMTEADEEAEVPAEPLPLISVSSTPPTRP